MEVADFDFLHVTLLHTGGVRITHPVTGEVANLPAPEGGGTWAVSKDDDGFGVFEAPDGSETWASELLAHKIVKSDDSHTYYIVDAGGKLHTAHSWTSAHRVRTLSTATVPSSSQFNVNQFRHGHNVYTVRFDTRRMCQIADLGGR